MLISIYYSIHIIHVTHKNNYQVLSIKYQLTVAIRFYRFLSDAPKPDVEKVHIPLVTLLVNGGDGSLEACAESLCNQIPLVAIVGSGRAAEVVILIHKFMIKYKKQ